ncbi:hypothetical protein L9F63_002149, partial [Diploptera punctata]
NCNGSCALRVSLTNRVTSVGETDQVFNDTTNLTLHFCCVFLKHPVLIVGFTNRSAPFLYRTNECSLRPNQRAFQNIRSILSRPFFATISSMM